MYLALVVADPGASEDLVRRCAEAARRELGTGDELVWVGDGGGPPGTVGFGGPPGGRGAYYAAGLARTRAPLVAFTDAFTELAPGWRAAAVGALQRGACVVGGPVLPSMPRSIRSLAGFLVEYGAHAAPPFTSASGDVSGNNVAYERASLEAVLSPGEDVWKSVVDARLAAKGHGPRLVRAMRVTSHKTWSWRDLAGVQVARGRLYGSQRALSGRWTVARRLAMAAACIALPALASARLAVRIRGLPPPRIGALLAFPLVVAALVAWSIGEAGGYIRRNGDGRDVF